MIASIYDYQIFKEIAEAFETATGIHVPEKVTAFVFLMAFAIAIILFVLKPIIKNHKWRKKQLDDILKDYGEYTTWQQRWLYIKTWFQANPPHDLDEPSMAQYEDGRTDSIDFFINEALVSNNRKPPFYCILGGSGMGKSTFVVNLVWRYIHKYREKTFPYPIKLLYCGERVQEKDVLIDRIKEIENKSNTILVLDALDESNWAIDNYNDFYVNLLENIVEFRFVIITCRTQFFEKHEDEPEIVPVRKPASKKQKQFMKFYVSPLKDSEVRGYLNKKYLLRFSAKKKAKAIVKNCNQIMARPLLLSYIDDLLNSNIEDRPESIIQIYEIIIDKWLEREANFAATGDMNKYTKMLLEFSSEYALCLVQPTFKKTATGVAFNSHEDQKKAIIERYKPYINEKNLKGRSLLNRDTKDEYKFAHKSFMEYLVAKQIFEQKKRIPLESIDCVSNDMIPVFLSYMIMIGERRSEGCYDIVLSDTFSFMPRLYDPSGLYYYGVSAKSLFYGPIRVECDVTDNIVKYISTFLKIPYNTVLKERKVIESRIVIDCNYDCSKIIELFDVERNRIIHMIDKHCIDIELLNYNFHGTWLIEFLNSLNESSPVSSVTFNIRNKRVIAEGDPKVIQVIRDRSARYTIPEIQVLCKEGNGRNAGFPVNFNTFYFS